MDKKSGPDYRLRGFDAKTRGKWGSNGQRVSLARKDWWAQGVRRVQSPTRWAKLLKGDPGIEMVSGKEAPKAMDGRSGRWL